MRGSVGWQLCCLKAVLNGTSAEGRGSTPLREGWNAAISGLLQVRGATAAALGSIVQGQAWPATAGVGVGGSLPGSSSN